MLIKDVTWRAMTDYDLPAVQAIADVVHPDFFEAPDVLAERYRLYRKAPTCSNWAKSPPAMS